MKPKTSTAAFERAARPSVAKVILRLYIAGTSDRSIRAIRNAKEICEAYLAGNYELAVVDILQQPTLAKDDQIVAVPILVKRLPLPPRRFVGDLSNRDVVVAGLGLEPE
ncbi:MAG TPA: circadian clock KaiB family protein [Acidimicrobiia bacterium]|nr:circadian clock KaiB family protein [Acidimicrobiia bacterium]